MRVLSLVPVTTPDIAGGRRLYGLDDLSDEDCLNVMRHQCRESSTAGDEALGPHLRRISGMAWAVLDDDRPSIAALSARTRDDEPALLAAVLEALAGSDRFVVGSRACLDLIRVRALLHGVPGPVVAEGWPAGEVVDLAGILSGVDLRDFIALAGLPGVGDGLDAQARAEVEALGQLLLERRLALLEGRSTAAEHRRCCRGLNAWLAADDRPHLRAYAREWTGREFVGGQHG